MTPDRNTFIPLSQTIFKGDSDDTKPEVNLCAYKQGLKLPTLSPPKITYAGARNKKCELQYKVRKGDNSQYNAISLYKCSITPGVETISINGNDAIPITTIEPKDRQLKLNVLTAGMRGNTEVEVVCDAKNCSKANENLINEIRYVQEVE